MPVNKTLDLIRAASPTISAGIMAADLMHLSSEIDMLANCGIKMIHFDIMDGCFVPAMTAGSFFVKGIKTDLIKDIHLLIENPQDKTEEYIEAGADIITIHIDACEDPGSILREMGKMKNKNHPDKELVRGIAINPNIPVAEICPFLQHVEMVTLLAIDPSIKGQAFQDSAITRFAELKKLTSSVKKDIILCIDGGVKQDNIAIISTMGADVVVSGSALFKANDPSQNIKFMLNSLKSKS